MERRLVRKLGLMLAATGLAGALMLSTGSAAAEPPLPGPPAPIDPMAMPGSPPEPFVLSPDSIQGPLSDPSRPAPPAGLVRAADVQSRQWRDGRCGQADHHQLLTADRRPRAGRASRSHLLQPARAREVLHDE
jgi:hypothetical protein